MALTERTVIDKVEADRYGNVSIRETTEILRDGEVIAHTYHRRAIAATDAVDTREAARVKALVTAARTDAETKPPESQRTGAATRG